MDSRLLLWRKYGHCAWTVFNVFNRCLLCSACAVNLCLHCVLNVVTCVYNVCTASKWVEDGAGDDYFHDGGDGDDDDDDDGGGDDDDDDDGDDGVFGMPWLSH